MADFTFSRVGEPKESLYTHVILPVPPAEPSPVPVPSPEPPPPSAANAPTTGDASVAAATRPAIVALPHFLFLLEPNVPSPFRDSVCRTSRRAGGTGRRERAFPARFPSRGPAHPTGSTRTGADGARYGFGGLRGMEGTGKGKAPSKNGRGLRKGQGGNESSDRTETSGSARRISRVLIKERILHNVIIIWTIGRRGASLGAA